MPVTLDPVIAADTFSSNPQPTIDVDAALRLRPFLDTDASAVAAAFSDAAIVKWHGFRIDTPEQAQEWIEGTRSRWAADTAANWAMAGTDDVAMGRIGLYVNFRKGTSEIAYWVLPSFRRQGVAVRCVQAITTWAHESLGLHRILLQHSVDNPASCAVARSAGYAVEGTARQQDLHDDGWHDMHQHAHLAGD